ncbi:MAG: hypothetical protein Q9209_007283 [Squamulea sp. 1 TL-2023]
MNPLFSAETRRRLQENDPKWRAKAILQAICTFLAFIALILFADATAITNRYYVLPHGGWSDWMPLFPVLISLIYNPVAFFLLLRRRGKPIHPAWHVGVHLLVWVLGIPSIVLSVGYAWFWWWQPVYYTSIFEFTLFVLACIVMHKHRRAIRSRRMPTGLSQLQYHRDPEAHAAQQPPAYTPSEEHEPVVTKPSATRYS